MAGQARREALHDAAYYGLAALFYVAPRLLYEIHIEAAAPAPFPPSTLIVANHKRDLDSVVLPATLFWLQPAPRAPLWFAGREDMFLRGFLAGYDVLPRWFRRLLYEMDLTGVMRALRVLPVRRFPERTMDEALREALVVLGDRPLAEVLSDDAIPVSTHVGAPRSLTEALRWRYYDVWRAPARMRAFREPARTTLEARQREIVSAQITHLAALLDGGAVLYVAPEGLISPDGRLQAFRSGLRRVLDAATHPVSLRPAGIIYDFMRPGRLRIFIAVGGAFPAHVPDETAQEARRRLALLQVMTASQLCSYIVWRWAAQRRLNADAAALTEETRALTAHLGVHGMRVDPDLRGARLPRRVADWIAYALRRRVLARGPHGLAISREALAAQPVGHATNPVRYAVNELTSVCEALEIPLLAGDVPNAAASGGG